MGHRGIGNCDVAGCVSCKRNREILTFNPSVEDRLKFNSGSIKELVNQVENLKMVCRLLSNAKTLKSRDRIAKQCQHLFEGSILR